QLMATHRIFVVDDEDMIRDSIVEFLDENGYEAIGAAHGRDALDKLTASGPRPCLILLDLMMPVMDGQSFREQQLQTPELAAIPVVVFSAYRDVEKTTTGIAASSGVCSCCSRNDCPSITGIIRSSRMRQGRGPEAVSLSSASRPWAAPIAS